MDKKIDNNGFDYVDLGLPSGTLWATCNVGAKKPLDYGLYFSWGDTIGHTKEEVVKDKQFTWKDYKCNPNGNGGTFTKYNAKGTTLELEDDAAHTNMGGDWHIPSPEQIRELIRNTTSEWTTQDSVNGILFASNKDTSRSIFIPAAGFAWDGSIYGSGSYGLIWSSMLSTDYFNYGQYLYFNSEDAYLSISARLDGFTVRGVIDSNGNSSKEKENKMNERSNFAEMLENELKKNLKIKITSDYGGYVEVNLLYKGEVIDSDVCQVTTDFNPLDA